jgi:cytochrome c553
MISRSLPLFVLGASLAGLNGITVAASSPLTAEQTEFFEKKIRPVLVAECVECHNADKQKGGLRIGVPRLLMDCGRSGSPSSSPAGC